MFRIRTADGKSAYNQVAGVHNALVISKEMAEALYHGQKVSGRKVKYADYDNLFTIAAVASSIRNSEYERPEMCFYQCLDGELYAETVNDYSAQRAELCVRMKKAYTDDDMDHFLEEMGDQLIVHNLYVSGVRSIADSRSMRHFPTQLSGGQCQRVAIARAIVGNPDIILADEPTGNLDSKMGAEVMEILHKLNKEDGRTIVMVTHNEAQAQQTSRVVRFFDGRQVE